MDSMQTHVKVLGVLHIVFGILGILIGLGVMTLFGGLASIVQMEGDPDAATAVPILGAIGGVVLVVLLVLSIPGIIAGAGLLSFKPWARILMIVISILDLVNFPFGTALGIYGLWVLLTADGARLFEPQRGPASAT
jgi:hypothetical protein